MTPAVCQEGGEDCDPATCPDPRFPRLDDGNRVLCQGCFEAACEEMRETLEHDLECQKYGS